MGTVCVVLVTVYVAPGSVDCLHTLAVVQYQCKVVLRICINPHVSLLQHYEALAEQDNEV